MWVRWKSNGRISAHDWWHEYDRHRCVNHVQAVTGVRVNDPDTLDLMLKSGHTLHASTKKADWYITYHEEESL